MAKPNDSTSAISCDREQASSSVPSNADKARAGLSRRSAMQIMTSAAAVPVTAFGAAMPAFARRTDRSPWDAAMARFRIADREADEAGARFNGVEEKFFELLQKIPHVTIGPDLYTGRTQPVSTEDAQMVREARTLVRQLAEGRRWHEPGIPGLEEHTQFCRNLAAAADKRDAQIEALDAELGYSKANDAHDAAIEKMCAARDRLIEMPAPDGEALLWKLDWLFFSDHCWTEEGYVDQTVADTRRMLAVH
jgi:hypothetical protein